MLLKGGGFLSILFVVFIGWIFISDSAETRLERSCKPVQWTGTVVVSLVDLTIPAYSHTVDGWVDTAEYSCQYTLWRLFYEKAWLEQKKKESKQTIILKQQDQQREGRRYHD